MPTADDVSVETEKLLLSGFFKRITRSQGCDHQRCTLIFPNRVQMTELSPFLVYNEIINFHTRCLKIFLGKAFEETVSFPLLNNLACISRNQLYTQNLISLESTLLDKNKTILLLFNNQKRNWN